MESSAQVSGGASAKWSSLQALVVGLCFFINMFDGMDVLIISYVAPAVTQDWQVSSARFGAVFSGGLVGMAIGGLLIAPLADRYGRRRLILASLVVMMAGMFASGFARNVTELVLCRVVVGVGIGTVLAGMAAITAEYAPPHHRSFAVGFLQAGYPIGAVATGFVAAWLLPHHGWRPLLIGGGVISLVLLPIVFLLMPESVAFLRRVGGPDALERINSLRVRMGQAPVSTFEALDAASAELGEEGAPPSLRSTLLLWTAVFMAMMVLYFVVSWIPKLAIEAGLDIKKAIYAGASYNVGAAVGIVALSLLSIRVRLQTLVPVFLVLAAAMMVVFGSVSMPVAGVLAVAFMIGVTVQGGFNGLYPLAAQIYPTGRRSAGVGRAMGVGRGGAVVGPLLGGYLLTAAVPLPALFGTFAVPLLIAAACAFLVVGRRVGEPASLARAELGARM